MVAEEKEKNDKELKGEKEKGSTEIKGRVYEATSPDVLLLPFLSVGNDTSYTLPTRMAQYISLKLAEYNKKYPLLSATSLDKEMAKMKIVLSQIPTNKS